MPCKGKIQDMHYHHHCHQVCCIPISCKFKAGTRCRNISAICSSSSYWSALSSSAPMVACASNTNVFMGQHASTASASQCLASLDLGMECKWFLLLLGLQWGVCNCLIIFNILDFPCIVACLATPRLIGTGILPVRKGMCLRSFDHQTPTHNNMPSYCSFVYQQ